MISNTTCLSATFLKTLSFKSLKKNRAACTVNWLICSMMYKRLIEKMKHDLRAERQCCTEIADLDSPLRIRKLLEKQS